MLANHRLKQPATAVTALAGSCGETDTGPGSARFAPGLAADYMGRWADMMERM